MVESIIDNVQSAKKQFVNTYITDKVTREALNKFVDSQTDFAKQTYKTMETLGKEFQTQVQSFGFKPGK